MRNIDYLKKYYKGNTDEAIERLNNGEPIQYIVGNVDFYKYNFIVNKNVLIPRFETEELVLNTINFIKTHNLKDIKIIDIGTGSGAIAITLKKELNAEVYATDISSEALEVASLNAKRNDASINFINTNLYAGVKEKFDVVISNPPYIRYDEEIDEIVKNNEPHIALYADNEGLYFYEQILKNIKTILNEKYLIAFEIGKDQYKAIEELKKKYLPESKIILKKDLEGRDRMVFIHNFE